MLHEDSMKSKKVQMKSMNAALGRSGAALILALLMITILVVFVLETMRAMQVEGAGARHFQDSIRAEALAKSGVNIAISMLKNDLAENEVDHIGEPWALLPKPDALPVDLSEAGTLEGRVEDEMGKFPINYLVDEDGKVREVYQQVLTRLLTNTPFQMEEEEAQGLVMAIRDWLDKDDEPTGEFGGETDYYQSLEQAYECKNGPLTSLAELRLIRGVSESLYVGTEENPGLKDLLTVYSDGKINVNTAGPLVLQALVSPTVSQDTAEGWAESVVAYRQEPMHWDFLSESDWYRNRMAGYNDISLPVEFITTQSMHFTVQMKAKVGVGRKSIFAYLERRKSEKEEQETVDVSVRYKEVY
jgi:general secretion pathway protein K